MLNAQCSLGIVVGTSFFACPVALASDLEPLDSVNGLKFIQSTDWEYQALQSLAQSHNCGIELLSNHRSRPLSRDEFALALNECLQQIKPFSLSQEDLITLQKLQQDFAQELAQLTTKAEPLEADITQLKSQQFSTTTKLIPLEIRDIESNSRVPSLGARSLGEETSPGSHRLLRKPQQGRDPSGRAAQASEFGQIESVSRNHTQRQINLVEPLQFNLETFVEKNSPDPGISIKLKKIEPKFGQIDSDFTDINVGSVDIKANAVKSELDIDSQDLETELTLLSQRGFKLKMIGEFQNSDRKLKIGPVVSFKKSLNWLQEQSQTEAEDKKVSLQQAHRSAVLRRLTLNSAYFNSLRINQGNEIDDSSKDIQTLTKSLNSLTTSEFATNTTFSFEGDLEELSAKLEFPVPGILRDELELKIKTNLPEVMLDGEDGQENMKSTLSLRYRIGINDAIKLEIQSSYNLRTTTASHKIMFKLF